MWGSAVDQTLTWTNTVKKVILMVVAMFMVYAKDGACSTYYTGNLLFDHVPGGLASVPVSSEDFGHIGVIWLV